MKYYLFLLVSVLSLNTFANDVCFTEVSLKKNIRDESIITKLEDRGYMAVLENETPERFVNVEANVYMERKYRGNAESISGKIKVDVIIKVEDANKKTIQDLVKTYNIPTKLGYHPLMGHPLSHVTKEQVLKRVKRALNHIKACRL